MSAISCARLAAIAAGLTVAAKAISKAPAAISACAALFSACTAAVLIQVTKDFAAAAIDSDAGPRHWSPASAETTESYETAAESNSAANPFQAEAAAIIGADPGPEYISAELISGHNAAKSIILDSVTASSCHVVAIALAASVAAYDPALIDSVWTNIS